jgi:hypothetical protein
MALIVFVKPLFLTGETNCFHTSFDFYLFYCGKGNRTIRMHEYPTALQNEMRQNWLLQNDEDDDTQVFKRKKGQTFVAMH